MKKKKILYQKYIADQQEKKQNEQLAADLGEVISGEEAIVIKKEAAWISLIHTFLGLARSIVQAAIYVAILLLASVGATTLINNTTREAFLLLFR